MEINKTNTHYLIQNIESAQQISVQTMTELYRMHNKHGLNPTHLIEPIQVKIDQIKLFQDQLNLELKWLADQEGLLRCQNINDLVLISNVVMQKHAHTFIIELNQKLNSNH